MNSKKLIEKTSLYVKKKLADNGSGHDWWHIYRVWSIAKKLATMEGADPTIVELAALLHDIADWKFNGGDGVIRKISFLEPMIIRHAMDHPTTVSFACALRAFSSCAPVRRASVATWRNKQDKKKIV